MALKKKQKNLLMAIAVSGTAAYFVRTFLFGDTIIGALIGGALAGPPGAAAGALTGALVPSKKEGGFSILEDFTLPIVGVPETAGAAPSGTATA